MNAAPPCRDYNAHAEAVRCLAEAEKLLADDTSIRYGCLELRLCIEHAVFDELQLYLKEISDEALRKWTPRDVISELLSVDDHAEDTATISYRAESAPGQPVGPSRFMGVDRRLSMKWASRAHSALGSFLHAPTLAQLEGGGGFDPAAARKKAEEIAGYLRKLLSGPAFRANFGVFIGMDCERCGRPIKRRAGKIPEEGVQCPNRQCGALYEITPAGEGEVDWKLRQVPFTCACENTFYLDAHGVREGNTFGCSSCGRRFELELQARITSGAEAAAGEALLPSGGVTKPSHL